MSNRQPPSNDELEVAEAKNPLSDLLYDYTAQAMTTRAGSYVYHRFDACLAIVEKTAKWSLPQSPPPSEEDTSKMNISPPPLIRPLPWILFLPALIALRLLRVSLSFVALLIGKQPVYPITMVSFLQARRRKLRALKYRGQKIQRIKRAERESEEKAEEQLASSWLHKITLPLRYIVCLRAVRPGTSIHQREHHHHHHHHHGPSRRPREVANDATIDEHGGPRKRNAHERDAEESDSSCEEASVQELLDKYAHADGDSSYHASDSHTSESDSFVSESDKSHTEQADPSEQNESKKIKTESNGHAAASAPAPAEKQPAGSQKPEEPKKKSALNAVDNGDRSGEETKPKAATAPVAENGNAAPKTDPKVESQTDPKQNPEKPSSVNDDNKSTNQSLPVKDQPADSGAKSGNPDSSKNKSPAPMKEAKSNNQQKSKNQHQQQQQPPAHNNQQQQQQHPQQQSHQQQQKNQQQQQHQSPATNGGGGSGGGGVKKHKKPHHSAAQQQHQSQQQHQQQQHH